jgi:hypothetical protein
MWQYLEILQRSALRSRALQGVLFLASFAAFVVAIYAQAAWLGNLAAAFGVAFGIAGTAGWWRGRRAPRGGAPRKSV